MLQLLLRCLACLALALCALPAAAKPPAAKGPVTAASLDADAAADTGSDSDSEAGSGNESVGIECLPAISEVETRRPIPFSCSVTKDDVEAVELRYKAPGRKKWTKLRLKKTGKDWTGEIPCTALTKRGALKLSIVGLDSDDKTVARIGGVEIKVVDASNEPPPAYPGREPPMRCYDGNECPPELRGSPACPGTKAAAGLHTWGSACAKTSECQQGLACISGSCDKPAKCESKADCGTGECEGGTCTYPDPDEIASRLGPPKLNWIGVHFGIDLLKISYAPSVCGDDAAMDATGDQKDYTCYNGSTANNGKTLNRYSAGNVPDGFALSTMRFLLSYDRWFGRLGLGGRAGFAFGGAPKDFSPIHVEARVMYSMRADQLNKRFRPYIGIAGGVAEVDSHSKVTVIECKNSMDVAKCQDAKTIADVVALGGTPVQTKLDAYKAGAGVFFGPTIGFLYALTNDSGIAVNLNVMFPDIAFEPSLGYVFGL